MPVASSARHSRAFSTTWIHGRVTGSLQPSTCSTASFHLAPLTNVAALTAADRRRPVDEVLVAALAAGATHAAAANAAGVSERTVRRRLNDPTFHASVIAERDALVRRVATKLTGLSATTVETLEKLLGDGVPPADPTAGPSSRRTR